MTTALTRVTARDLILKHKDEFAKALPPEVKPDLFMRVALTAMLKTPKLLECSQESIMQALLDLAQLGLVPDSVSGEAYLVPYNDRQRGMICQLQPGYLGLLKLAYNSPKVKAIRGSVVYEGDSFEYSDGLEPKLVHTRGERVGGLPMVKAWAIAELADNARTWVVIDQWEWLKAKASSKSAAFPTSPWNLWEEAMILKTVLKKLCKLIPRSRQLSEALAKDADDSVIDVASQVMNQTPTLAMEIPEAAPASPVEPSPAPTMAIPSESHDHHPELEPAPPPKPKSKVKATAPVAQVVKPVPQDAAPASPPPVTAPAPVTTPFPEKEEHKALRKGIADRGISEAAILKYLRGEQLIDDAVSDINMIPVKRATTITMSLDTIKEQLDVIMI